MPITFSIHGSKRPTAIYVRYREGKKIDARARTKFLVNPEDWSKAKGKPKESDHFGKALARQLDDLRRTLSERLSNRQPNEQINTEWLKAFLSPEKQPTTSLIEYYDRYIAAREKEVAQGKAPKSLVSRYRSNQAMLKEIDPTIQIENVNPIFISRFQEHAHKKGYAPTTIARAAKYILTVCRDARRNGLPTHKELDYIKVKTVKVKHIYLTFEELEKITKQELPEYLDNARDWLIISCFTGQRVSDFMRFTKDFIKEENGKQLIEFTQVKTKKVMTIPVHPKIGQILSKRNGDFPRQISDQKYNDYIKEVCRLAGITSKVQGSRKSKETNRKESGTFEKWKLVSSHIGRRSFASNFFGQIPTSLLMFVTGHTTEHQFYDYIGKAERTKAFQLAEYF